MASTRLTKTNIDKDTLAGMQLVAAAEGISTAMLIDKAWLAYLEKSEAYGNAKKA